MTLWRRIAGLLTSEARATTTRVEATRDFQGFLKEEARGKAERAEAKAVAPLAKVSSSCATVALLTGCVTFGRAAGRGLHPRPAVTNNVSYLYGRIKSVRAGRSGGALRHDSDEGLIRPSRQLRRVVGVAGGATPIGVDVEPGSLVEPVGG